MDIPLIKDCSLPPGGWELSILKGDTMEGSGLRMGSAHLYLLIWTQTVNIGLLHGTECEIYFGQVALYLGKMYKICIPTKILQQDSETLNTNSIYLLIDLKFYRHCYKFMQLSLVLRFFFEEYEWNSGYSQSQLLLYIYKKGLKVVAAFAYKNARYLCFPWVLLNWFSLCCIQMPSTSSKSYSLCILIFLIKCWTENYWLWNVY